MVKIRVKLGAAEAEVEAEMENLREAVDMIPEVLAKLPANSPGRREQVREFASHVPEPALPRGPTELPVVTLEKSDSLSDIISKFFSDPWGRDRRKLSDVREALQSYGLNYPKQSVAVALLRLAKTTKVRRFKADDGEYVYTASNALIAGPSAGAEAAEELAAAPEQN